MYQAGEKILFVDADDYLEEKALEALNIYNKKDYLVCFAYKKIYKNTQKQVRMNNFDNQDIQSLVIKTDEIGGYLWNKLFFREIIKKNNITFNEKIHFCEDILFVLEYAKYCKEFLYCNEILYNYRMRNSGVSFDFVNNKNVTILEARKELIQVFEHNQEIKEYLMFSYLINYYIFKEYIDKEDKFTREILEQENNIVRKQPLKKKIKYILVKHFKNLYFILTKLKRKKQKFFE